MRRWMLAAGWMISFPLSVQADEPAAATDETAASSEPEGQDGGDSLQGLDLQELLDITVVSASRQVEPLRESPVPVTVITSEMIRAINARNLEDVLVTYVPGMVSVEDANEENVAFRGIYASSQQKFLVMVNGHRLNHRAYLAANTDEGISVNPNYVKQIEVLRGPGSSVYGNVALNAVVNIITKSGAEIDGAHLRSGLGNFGQRTADFAYGASISSDSDLVIWGNVFDADGEEFDYTEDTQWLVDLETETATGGVAFVEGVDSPVNHDVGLQFQKGAWTLLAMHRSGRQSDPFTAGGRTGDLYDRENLRTFFRQSSGLNTGGAATRITFDDDLTDNFNLRVDLAYDRNSVTSTLATSSANNAVTIGWQEDAYSLIAQGRYYYEIEGAGDGNLLFGTHDDIGEFSIGDSQKEAVPE
ncbi:MAG: TonB-dependent receptor plug domain-containing protein, partial [Myxococcota bacterium]